jgi:hypothetical protein
MKPEDYQRFHNFLAAHDCKVGFREFRTAEPTSPATRRTTRVELPSRGAPAAPDTGGTRS